jgi:hypothetical protein
MYEWSRVLQSKQVEVEWSNALKSEPEGVVLAVAKATGLADQIR